MTRLAWLAVNCVMLAIWPSSTHVQADDEPNPRSRSETERAEREQQSQRQEVHRRLAEITQKLAQLRAANKPEQAAELEREVQQLTAQLREDSANRSQDLIRRQIEQLRDRGQNQEAAKLEVHLRETLENAQRAQAMAEETRQRFRESRERAERGFEVGRPRESAPEDLERRLNHLREAAENHSAAGLQEQAEQLRRQADNMRAESRDHSDLRPELKELHTLLRQQNERIERLEQIVHKLLQQSESSSAKPSDKSVFPDADFNKMLAFAQGVIKKYDKSGDGSLTKDEWSSMSKDPSAADFDGDGKISPPEYAKWILQARQ